MTHIHTRSITHKVHDAWRSPGRFTKNPDMVQLPSGRLLLVYSDNDQHWSQENQVLTVLSSDDLGLTWSHHAVVDQADLRKGDERLVTPRLSLLSDGRLAVLIDHDDYGHFHEDQPGGNWIYWSTDEGKTWSEHQETTISGFEPDRMIELPDGSLAVATHVMRGDSQEFADILTCSTDGGRTWHERSTIAHDGYHRFCEGAIVILDGGRRLACVLRENHSAGVPGFVCFSSDNGQNWSAPERCPFALHRPYAKQLPDGRVMVTGRNVNGGLGTYAWVGDLEREAGHYAVGGPRTAFEAELGDEGLTIVNAPGKECRYTLLPPEDSRSEVVFEAEVRIESDTDDAAAFLSVSTLNNTVLLIGRSGVWQQAGHMDRMYRTDMTRFRSVTIRHRRGLLQVLVDGTVAIQQNMFHDVPPVRDFRGGDPRQRTQFGGYGESGVSVWKSVRYDVRNRRLPAFSWAWRAADGWPDQYQRERLIQIHANDPDQPSGPDHGYSSWVILDDGRIVFVDYTNCGDEPHKSHLVGAIIEPEDIR